MGFTAFPTSVATALYILYNCQQLAPTLAADQYPDLEYQNTYTCRRTKGAWESDDDDDGSFGWTERVSADTDSISFTKSPAVGPGCYQLRATVTLRQPIREPFQARLIARLGGIRNEPLPCNRFQDDPDNCSKGWGSCILCDLCNTLNAQALVVNGVNQTLHCPLRKGRHTIVENICLPTVQDFANAIPEDLSRILQLEERNSDDEDVSKDLFIQLELYNKDIYSQCPHAYKIDECPVDQKNDMIGCLNIYTKVKVNLSEFQVKQAPVPGRDRD